MTKLDLWYTFSFFYFYRSNVQGLDRTVFILPDGRPTAGTGRFDSGVNLETGECWMDHVDFSKLTLTNLNVEEIFAYRGSLCAQKLFLPLPPCGLQLAASR